MSAAISSERRTICLGVERAVHQRAGGGERVVAAGADAHDAGFGFEHVAGAGEHQRHLRVGDDHHRLQPAQIAVGAPVLGELDGRAHQLSGILLELGFQPFEQREGVGGGAGKTADHVTFAEPPHLLGIGFDDGLADRDLAVAADGDQAALADGQNGRAVPGGRRGLRRLHSSKISLSHQDVRAETTGRNSIAADSGVHYPGTNRSGRSPCPIP